MIAVRTVVSTYSLIAHSTSEMSDHKTFIISNVAMIVQL